MKRVFKNLPTRLLALVLVVTMIFSYIPIRNTFADGDGAENVVTFEWSDETKTQLDFHNEMVTIPIVEFAALFGWTSPKDAVIQIYDGGDVIFDLTTLFSDVTNLIKLTNFEALADIGVTLEANKNYTIKKGAISLKFTKPYYSISWSDGPAFSTKVFDNLTVTANKPNVTSVAGMPVQDTTTVKVYRGETPDVVVSMGELLNHSVTAKIGTDTILNDVGTYTFAEGLTQDVVVDVVYVEDTESEIVLGTTSGHEAITYPLTADASSEVQVVIKPNEGYYVDSVIISRGGETVVLSAESYADGVWTGVFTTADTKGKYEINCVTKPMVVMLGSGIAYNETTTIDEAKALILALIDKDNSASIFADVANITLQYNAAYLGEDWKALDFTPAELDKLTKHAFGWDGKSETIKIVYAGDTAKYPAGEFIFELALADNRSDKAAIDINAGVEFTYGTFTSENVLAALLDGKLGLYDTESGKPLVDGKVELVTNVESLWAGEHTVTVRFIGNKDYKECTATAKLVIKKASAELTVNSSNIAYNESITIKDIVNINPSNVANVTFIVGLNAIDGVAIAQVDVSNLTHFDGVVGEAINKIFETVNGQDITLTKFKELVDKIASVDSRIDLTALNTIIDTLSQFKELAGINEVMLKLTTDGKLASNNVGAYIIGSALVDINYVSDMDFGYLLIKPNATLVTLAFNEKLDSILSINAMNNDAYDFFTSVKEEEHAAANDKINNVFFGITSEGEFKVANTPFAEIGAYAQIAYIAEFANEMYYAKPIVRGFAVLPDDVDIEFIGVDKESNSITFEYDKTAHGVAVLVKDKDGNPLNLFGSEHLTVKYVGLTSRGGIYNSTEAPTDTGFYTVIAIYKDEAKQQVGFNATKLVISAAKSLFEIKDKTVEYDGKEQFVTVYNPDALVHVDIVVNGKNISILMPESIMGEKGDFTGTQVINKIKELLLQFVEFDDDDVPAKLKDLLSKVEDYTVSVNLGKPSEIGVYDVYSLAFGYDYKAVADSAILTISEKVDEPTEPETPDKPEDPTDPEDPTKPSEPEQPTEPEDPTEPSEPEQPTEPSNPSEPSNPGEDAPQTGDSSNIGIAMTTFAMSSMGLIALFIMSIMKQNNGKYLAKNRKRTGKYLK